MLSSQEILTENYMKQSSKMWELEGIVGISLPSLPNSRWRKRRPERLIHFLKTTQLVTGRAGCRTQDSWSQTHFAQWLFLFMGSSYIWTFIDWKNLRSRTRSNPKVPIGIHYVSTQALAKQVTVQWEPAWGSFTGKNSVWIFPSKLPLK